jgi:hypothetical protein
LWDQAIPSLIIDTDNPILYSTFRKLIKVFHKAIIIVALSSPLFSVFGGTLLAHPSSIREGHCGLTNWYW